MIKHALYFCLLTICFCRCSKLENPEDVKASDKIVLFSSKDILAIKDTAFIFAKIPKDAGTVDITFTTTAGTFIEAAAKTIKQLTDSIDGGHRYAKVVFVSDTNVATVYITAEATNARTRKTIIVNK